ncbi:MAG: hypothetical protein NC489_29105 [Ruminococcus flavefaciens]|nr:hypothetical protein [Ruminococcus flavefaciens]
MIFHFLKTRKELKEVENAEKSLHIPLVDGFKKAKGNRRRRILERVRYYNKCHAEYLEELRKQNDKAE